MADDEMGGAPGGGGITTMFSRFGDNKLVLVGAIALIIIVVLFVLPAIGFDIFDSKPSELLVIGNSSQEVINILNDNRHLVNYTIKTPASLDRNPSEQIKDYDIILLDQSDEPNKEIPLELGTAIEAYVKAGGKLITVKDSGTKRPGATDVIGWKPTFGDTIPVECELQGAGNQPSCSRQISVRGKLLRSDEDSRIMSGIEVVPAGQGETITFSTFDVYATGNQVAYIEDSTGSKTYPGIVEKSVLLGKSIYFNYNPGKTRGIFEATISYLAGK